MGTNHKVWFCHFVDSRTHICPKDVDCPGNGIAKRASHELFQKRKKDCPTRQSAMPRHKADEGRIRARRNIDMSFRINFEEPIPDLIERLQKEHRHFESKLAELEAADTFNKHSMEILEELSGPIVRHAVEEEARIMRVILHKAKRQSEESIKIAQEHNWIADFMRKTMPMLASMSQQQAMQEVAKFVQNLRNHFIEEERVMFPLALKADSLQE